MSEQETNKDNQGIEQGQNGEENYTEIPDPHPILHEIISNEDIKENLLGIFVVSFDTRLGNIIEWQIPTDLNLKNIEFKAMASGLHLTTNDYLYFCKDEMYGLSAFGSTSIDNVDERNIRMKSVGIMAKSYKFLKYFITFLRNQVGIILENPDNYSNLEALWIEKSILNKSDLNEIKRSNNEISPVNQISLLDKIFNKRLSLYKYLNETSEADQKLFTKFTLYFGPSIFCLWRYVLLNKRVLFYSLPPINELCFRVLCSCQMLSTSLSFARGKNLIKPIFYVNVTDIETLSQEPFYIGCTTERIFESKKTLYDLFVNETELKAVLADSQKGLFRVNSADKKRYDILLKKLTDPSNTLDKSQVNASDKLEDDEAIFTQFFIDFNDKIFTILNEIENSEMKRSEEAEKASNGNNISMTTICKDKKTDQLNTLNSDVIKKMGLDPSDDRDFLLELIRFYDFHLILN